MAHQFRRESYSKKVTMRIFGRSRRRLWYIAVLVLWSVVLCIMFIDVKQSSTLGQNDTRDLLQYSNKKSRHDSVSFRKSVMNNRHFANLIKGIDFFSEEFLKFDRLLGEFNNLSRDKSDVSKNVTRIAIMIPSTTKNLKGQKLVNFTLVKEGLPTLLETLTNGFFYKIFIGFDSDDFRLSQVRETLSGKASTGSIELVKVEGRSFVAAVNEIAKTAYEQGMDYFVRVNDDTLFISYNWTHVAIEVLRDYDPPNIGVVGPYCREGKSSILTHDMVHKTHFEIFRYYYPPEFQNWWVDDWITQIYQPQRSTLIKEWSVQHLLQNKRYRVDMSLEKQLSKVITRDNEKVVSYVLDIRKMMNAGT